MLWPVSQASPLTQTQVVNATIVDNYNYAALICVGNSLNSPINCVGFNNGVGDSVFYVTITKSAENVLWLNYTALMGHGGPLSGTVWACKL